MRSLNPMRLLLLTALLAFAPASAPATAHVEHAHVDDTRAEVVGSSRSNVYHTPGCRHARRIASHNLVSWPSSAAARADGYRACRVCHPGT